MNFKKIKDSMSPESVFQKYAAKQTNPNFKDVKFEEYKSPNEYVDYAFALSYGSDKVTAEHDEDPEADLWTVTGTLGGQKAVHSVTNAVKTAINFLQEVVPVSKDRFNVLKS